MFRIDEEEHGFAVKFFSYFEVFPCLGALDEGANRRWPGLSTVAGSKKFGTSAET